MLILGIETSCDDTSIAVVRIENERIEVLSNIVSSQIHIHIPYGGVVPNLAAREHEINLPLVLPQALTKANVTMESIDLIAVTSGPGLIMSLVRGVTFAKELAREHNKPIIGVNHLEGHMYSAWLGDRKPGFPALGLSVAGGHTDLVLMNGHGIYEQLGRTLDDAAGEAFDKIARMLGLPYPGGPEIAREAEKFTGEKTISLPRPMQHSKDLNFSFSGLKTAVYYLVRDLKKSGDLTLEQIAEISHEAQEAIVDVLISKTKKAIEHYQPKSILLAGGVSANKLLRQHLQDLCAEMNVDCFLAPLTYSTDNAAMIALAGYFASQRASPEELHSMDFDANANWQIA